MRGKQNEYDPYLQVRSRVQQLTAIGHKVDKIELIVMGGTFPSTPIDYQEISYYSAPKLKSKPKSLDEVDPELLATYEKLGIPLRERELLAGVAVDAVFDSVSVATTFKGKLAEMGIIFCSFSEAVENHPDLVAKYCSNFGVLVLIRQSNLSRISLPLNRWFLLRSDRGSAEDSCPSRHSNSFFRRPRGR
jgi:Fe-S cluster assembly scaffold protein SufB